MFKKCSRIVQKFAVSINLCYCGAWPFFPENVSGLISAETKRYKNNRFCMKKVHALAKNGPRSSGKTTLGKLLSKLANSPAVIHIDTSKILEWVMDRHGTLGKELTKFKPNMARGFYTPDELVIPAAEMWLKCNVQDRPDVTQLIWTGWCRTRGQIGFLAANFKDYDVTYTPMSDEECIQTTMRRNELEGPRPDGTLEALQTHLRECREKTIPTMTAREYAHKILTLDFNHSLTHRLSQSAGLIQAPTHIRHRIRTALQNPEHWIHEEIARIEKGNPRRNHVTSPQVLPAHRVHDGPIHVSCR
ncbi:MAG: hypothetical protein V4481_01855 [Patescibacteria group bacterium]